MVTLLINQKVTLPNENGGGHQGECNETEQDVEQVINFNRFNFFSEYRFGGTELLMINKNRNF